MNDAVVLDLPSRYQIMQIGKVIPTPTGPAMNPARSRYAVALVFRCGGCGREECQGAYKAKLGEWTLN